MTILTCHIVCALELIDNLSACITGTSYEDDSHPSPPPPPPFLDPIAKGSFSTAHAFTSYPPSLSPHVVGSPPLPSPPLASPPTSTNGPSIDLLVPPPPSLLQHLYHHPMMPHPSIH